MSHHPSRLATLARRSFLVGSVAVLGGAAFGVWRYRQPHPNPLLDTLPEGSAERAAFESVVSVKVCATKP